MLELFGWLILNINSSDVAVLARPVLIWFCFYSDNMCNDSYGKLLHYHML